MLINFNKRDTFFENLEDNDLDININDEDLEDDDLDNYIDGDDNPSELVGDDTSNNDNNIGGESSEKSESTDANNEKNDPNSNEQETEKTENKPKSKGLDMDDGTWLGNLYKDDGDNDLNKNLNEKPSLDGEEGEYLIYGKKPRLSNNEKMDYVPSETLFDTVIYPAIKNFLKSCFDDTIYNNDFENFYNKFENELKQNNIDTADIKTSLEKVYSGVKTIKKNEKDILYNIQELREAKKTILKNLKGLVDNITKNNSFVRFFSDSANNFLNNTNISIEDFVKETAERVEDFFNKNTVIGVFESKDALDKYEPEKPLRNNEVALVVLKDVNYYQAYIYSNTEGEFVEDIQISINSTDVFSSIAKSFSIRDVKIDQSNIDDLVNKFTKTLKNTNQFTEENIESLSGILKNILNIDTYVSEDNNIDITTLGDIKIKDEELRPIIKWLEDLRNTIIEDVKNHIVDHLLFDKKAGDKHIKDLINSNLRYDVLEIPEIRVALEKIDDFKRVLGTVSTNILVANYNKNLLSEGKNSVKYMLSSYIVDILAKDENKNSIKNLAEVLKISTDDITKLDDFTKKVRETMTGKLLRYLYLATNENTDNAKSYSDEIEKLEREYFARKRVSEIKLDFTDIEKCMTEVKSDILKKYLKDLFKDTRNNALSRDIYDMTFDETKTSLTEYFEETYNNLFKDAQKMAEENKLYLESNKSYVKSIKDNLKVPEGNNTDFNINNLLSLGSESFITDNSSEDSKSIESFFKDKFVVSENPNLVGINDTERDEIITNVKNSLAKKMAEDVKKSYETASRYVKETTKNDVDNLVNNLSNFEQKINLLTETLIDNYKGLGDDDKDKTFVKGIEDILLDTRSKNNKYNRENLSEFIEKNYKDLPVIKNLDTKEMVKDLLKKGNPLNEEAKRRKKCMSDLITAYVNDSEISEKFRTIIFTDQNFSKNVIKRIDELLENINKSKSDEPSNEGDAKQPPVYKALEDWIGYQLNENDANNMCSLMLDLYSKGLSSIKEKIFESTKEETKPVSISFVDKMYEFFALCFCRCFIKLSASEFLRTTGNEIEDAINEEKLNNINSNDVTILRNYYTNFTDLVSFFENEKSKIKFEGIKYTHPFYQPPKEITKDSIKEQAKAFETAVEEASKTLAEYMGDTETNKKVFNKMCEDLNTYVFSNELDVFSNTVYTTYDKHGKIVAKSLFGDTVSLNYLYTKDEDDKNKFVSVEKKNIKPNKIYYNYNGSAIDWMAQLKDKLCKLSLETLYSIDLKGDTEGDKKSALENDINDLINGLTAFVENPSTDNYEKATRLLHRFKSYDYGDNTSDLFAERISNLEFQLYHLAQSTNESFKRKYKIPEMVLQYLDGSSKTFEISIDASEDLLDMFNIVNKVDDAMSSSVLKQVDTTVVKIFNTTFNDFNNALKEDIKVRRGFQSTGLLNINDEKFKQLELTGLRSAADKISEYSKKITDSKIDMYIYSKDIRDIRNNIRENISIYSKAIESIYDDVDTFLGIDIYYRGIRGYLSIHKLNFRDYYQMFFRDLATAKNNIYFDQLHNEFSGATFGFVLFIKEEKMIFDDICNNLKDFNSSSYILKHEWNSNESLGFVALILDPKKIDDVVVINEKIELPDRYFLSCCSFNSKNYRSKNTEDAQQTLNTNNALQTLLLGYDDKNSNNGFSMLSISKGNEYNMKIPSDNIRYGFNKIRDLKKKLRGVAGFNEVVFNDSDKNKDIKSMGVITKNEDVSNFIEEVSGGYATLDFKILSLYIVSKHVSILKSKFYKRNKQGKLDIDQDLIEKLLDEYKFTESDIKKVQDELGIKSSIDEL